LPCHQVVVFHFVNGIDADKRGYRPFEFSQQLFIKAFFVKKKVTEIGNALPVK
jgi:hypothetical protein